MSDLDGLRDMLEAVAVSRETDANIKGTVPPVGAALGAGGTVQVPPTRHGDPISLTGACDTFVTLALLSARQGEDREDRHARGRQGRSGSSLLLLWTGILCQGEPLGAEIVGCALDPSAHDGPVSEAIGTANGHPCERLSALTFALAAH